MTLRDFQFDVRARTYEAWQEPNVINVMPVIATGGGKTVLFCDIVANYQSPSVLLAHRQELIGQASLALNREKVQHSIVAPKEVRQQIIRLHHDEHGYSCFNHRSETKAASVKGILNVDKTDRWLSQVGLLVHDEGHHVLRDNEFGSAIALFPNARGLFPTAHAFRADRKGLGRSADGLVDRLVVGPCCRELIDRGFLTDFRVLCPRSDIDFSDLQVGATGDFSMPKLRAVTHASNQIVGDVVKNYLKYAGGKLGVTFAVDIEAALEIANAYNAAGVPAKVITSKTPTSERGQLMRQFRARTLLQLVSVDCLGEGVDVPAIEVISMARKTASRQLFAQQFGRALRVLVGSEHAAAWNSYTNEQRRAVIADSQKPLALIIDHVGNYIYFAEQGFFVDRPQQYDLDRGESAGRGKTDGIPMRSCLECLLVYERFHVTCPHCGEAPVPSARSTPEQVEGDLEFLDTDALYALHKEIARIDGAPPPVYAGPLGGHINAAHIKRQEAQAILRKSMQLWGGWQEKLGMSTREAQKKFWFAFGVDIMSAQTISTGDAYKLNGRIQEQLAAHGVYAA